ncbi:MAG: DUF1273 family protein [Roseofilum sp. SID3]|uniref:SLOG family protein n=1 Tax=Roseofilum sp. SID3 TaxID=2821499 RepID=UPI001B2F0E5B|nr:SLOG family protein [Roseofilum sp. SID3]MBP0015337.1 DUF1273 family protein [Roseofilum sp. SID3]
MKFSKEECAFFTGHRDVWIVRSEKGIKWLINCARAKGIKHFYCGMALGVDQQVARILIDWNLSWTAVIPCGDQDKLWTNKQKKAYQQLLKLAPFKKVLYPKYEPGVMQARNRWMIERSCACLAVWRQWKESGGTYHTVQAAKKEGLAIAVFDPDKQEGYGIDPTYPQQLELELSN